MITLCSVHQAIINLGAVQGNLNLIINCHSSCIVQLANMVQSVPLANLNFSSSIVQNLHPSIRLTIHIPLYVSNTTCLLSTPLRLHYSSKGVHQRWAHTKGCPISLLLVLMFIARKVRAYHRLRPELGREGAL